MSGLPTWWFRTEYFWTEYPNKMTPEIKIYYLLQFSYWLQQMLVLVLKIEKPRPDFVELCIHVRLRWRIYRRSWYERSYSTPLHYGSSDGPTYRVRRSSATASLLLWTSQTSSWQCASPTHSGDHSLIVRTDRQVSQLSAIHSSIRDGLCHLPRRVDVRSLGPRSSSILRRLAQLF